MGTKYSATAVTGYNATPPADDASQTAANQIFWSTIKTKLADPFNTFASALDTKIAAALDQSARKITTSDSTIAGDHFRTIEIGSTVSTGITVSLGDAATMAAGYIVTINNQSAFSHTIGRVTSANTINGTAANLTIAALTAVTLKVNASVNGYMVEAQPNTPVVRSSISGLTLSTAGSSATMSIAAGQAADSTNVAMMTLTAIGKTTSAWGVGTGNGGLDTGVIANSTWYHFYEIMRVDTGVVDVAFSLSASAPTLPTNYTLFRRIGSGKTNGSAQWIKFIQDGNLFQWDVIVADISANNPGTSAVTRTLTVPTGVIVRAIIQQILSQNNASQNYIYVSDLAVSDQAPSAATIQDLSNSINSSQQMIAGSRMSIRTNNSAQIRTRVSLSDASTQVVINTLGWIDTRGRDL